MRLHAGTLVHAKLFAKVPLEIEKDISGVLMGVREAF